MGRIRAELPEWRLDITGMRRKVIQPYSGHLAKSKNASYSVNRASGASSGVTALPSTLPHKPLYDIRNFGVTEEELRKRLEILKIEHRDLDAAIDALGAAGSTDQLQIARLKKRKLSLKDQIAQIEDYLIPDIIA